MEEMENKTDRELLMHLVEESAAAKNDRCWLKKIFTNHLAHHTKLEIGLFLIIVGAIVTAIVTICI